MIKRWSNDVLFCFSGSIGSDSGDHIRRALEEPIPLNLDREIEK
jgi:hypothetical protein